MIELQTELFPKEVPKQYSGRAAGDELRKIIDDLRPKLRALENASSAGRWIEPLELIPDIVTRLNQCVPICKFIADQIEAGNPLWIGKFS